MIVRNISSNLKEYSQQLEGLSKECIKKGDLQNSTSCHLKKECELSKRKIDTIKGNVKSLVHYT